MLYKTSFVWLRFFRRKTYLWMILAIEIGKLTYFGKTERDREKASLQIALAKIDFVKFYALLNDLLW